MGAVAFKSRRPDCLKAEPHIESRCGAFFVRKRSGLHALNEQIRVEGAGPKPPPRSEDTESLQVGVVRHAHRDCSRHGPSPRERIVFTRDDYRIAGVNKGDNCTKVLEAAV